MPKTVTELYAWIAAEADGDEGVPAISIEIAGREMMAPLIGAGRKRVESHREHAALVGAAAGARVRLCRFQLVEELEEL